MRTLAVVTAALLMSGAAADVMAQARPLTPPPPRPMEQPTATQQMSRFESEEQRRRFAPTVEEAEALYGAERVALAEQVQALIDAGRCAEARAMANEAGERQMALRVRQTCRRRS